ncbi:hypothetical protein [Bradyrhizobium sp. USDA 4516]
MASASAYILIVRPERRSTLLNSESGWFGGPKASEPVPVFDHSRRAPLVLLASFEDGYLTHVGDARKGASAGTALVRLNMTSLEALAHPIPFREVLRRVPPRFKTPLTRIATKGGLVSPKALRALVDVLSDMDSLLADKLRRLSASRRELIDALNRRQRENLALQKESVAAALEIAGVDTDKILEWSPPASEQTFFLDGLPGTAVREDVMLHADITELPGFAVIREQPYLAARTFQANDNPDVRVTILMANRLPLEQQTGADLIYFNSAYRSFVMVQYKALEKGAKEHEFRWTDGDQFCDEVARMDQLLEELSKIEPDTDPDGFRLTSNPFFLKFCSRVVFNPDDKGMFPGIYLPHGLWKVLANSGRLKGARGGNVLTYANVGRRLSGTDFVALVGSSWIGTTIPQTIALERLFRSVLATGRTLTFAVKTSRPAPGGPIGPLPGLDDSEDLPDHGMDASK